MGLSINDVTDLDVKLTRPSCHILSLKSNPPLGITSQISTTTTLPPGQKKMNYLCKVAATVYSQNTSPYYLRASAQLRVFCRSGETAAAAEYSWLCARTVKETLRSHIVLTILCNQCVRYTSMDFVDSVAVCALLLRTKAKRRKRLWVHPLVSQKLLKGQFHTFYEDLLMHPK